MNFPHGHSKFVNGFELVCFNRLRYEHVTAVVDVMVSGMCAMTFYGMLFFYVDAGGVILARKTTPLVQKSDFCHPANVLQSKGSKQPCLTSRLRWLASLWLPSPPSSFAS